MISQTTCLATDQEACVATCPSNTTFVSGGCVCSGKGNAKSQVLVSEPISSANAQDFYNTTSTITAIPPNATATYNFDSQFCICGQSAGGKSDTGSGGVQGRKLSQNNLAPVSSESQPEPQYAIAICCPTET